MQIVKKILFNAGWDGPLFWLNDQMVNTGPVNEADLPISSSLRDQLRDFNCWHEELCGEGSPSPLDERLYDERGAALWEQLSKELGGVYEVVYPSHEFDCEFGSPEELRT